MLMQRSILSPIETAVSSVSNHGHQEFIRDWSSGDGAWQELPEGNKHPQEGCEKAVPITECKDKDDNSCSPNLLSCSRLSAVTTSESSTHISVYKRRKIQKKASRSEFPASNSSNTMPIDYCLSASSCETLSATTKRDMVSQAHANEVVLPTPHVHPIECCKLSLASKLVSVDGCSLGDEPATEQDPKGDVRKGLLWGIHDSCSSSKSCLDLGSSSSKPEMDDNGECSSSGSLAVDGLSGYLSEKDLCISFLRSHGVLGGMKPLKGCASAGPISIENDRSCLRSCKVCLQSEITLKMLICDQCEGAFHVSCCNPGIKKIPVDEWFCHSCFRKKLKKLETGSSKSLNVTSNKGRWKTVSPKDELSPIECMLRGAELYTTKVRVGKEFQAEVPDWSGPIAQECNYFGEALEVSSSECVSYQGCNSKKPSRIGSIGNWLQCQEVIYGVGEVVDGTICGKWRRAPLFEVQSDNWECFCSVLWDLTHADCSVPQELDTDQVLKQLKYIEMLRPRLAAKRSKLGVPKESDSQEP